jgi:DNA-binding SARP family transcriptional activator
MEFRLLGPFEVVVDGEIVPLGGAKPRALLATLVLQRGRVVPVGRLVDLIWVPTHRRPHARSFRPT